MDGPNESVDFDDGGWLVFVRSFLQNRGEDVVECLSRLSEVGKVFVVKVVSNEGDQFSWKGYEGSHGR